MGRSADWSDMPFPRIGDEPWQREAVQWAMDAYSQAARSVFKIVRSHPFAVEYLQQAPIIAICEPRKVGVAINQGARLRNMMATLELAFPLKRLAPRVCTCSRRPLFLAISRLNPSLVAQALPDTEHQVGWVTALTDWRSVMVNRGLDGDHHLEWAVVNANRATTQGVSLRDVADAAAALGPLFNPHWSLERAVKASVDWHTELARTNGAAREYKRLGIGFDEPVDYGDLPVLSDVHGLTFVALQSGADLHADGRRMRHCVASYGKRVVTGRCRIYSVRRGITPLATVEVIPQQKRWSLEQIKGPCNAAPDQTVVTAAEAFVESLPKIPAKVSRGAQP